MSSIDPNDPGASTIEEIHDHLAKHPEDTAAVLAAEQARGDDARVTLVSSLEGQSAPEQQVQIEETPAKPEDERISPPGEYPTDESAVPGTWGYESDAPGVQAGREASQPDA